MNDKELALILFSIRELQLNIQFAPDQILATLKDYYGAEFANSDELFTALDELAISLNCGGENV